MLVYQKFNYEDKCFVCSNWHHLFENFYKKNISIKNVIVNEQNNYHYNINLFLNHHFELSEQQEDNFKQCLSTQL